MTYKHCFYYISSLDISNKNDATIKWLFHDIAHWLWWYLNYSNQLEHFNR